MGLVQLSKVRSKWISNKAILISEKDKHRLVAQVLVDWKFQVAVVLTSEEGIRKVSELTGYLSEPWVWFVWSEHWLIYVWSRSVLLRSSDMIKTIVRACDPLGVEIGTQVQGNSLANKLDCVVFSTNNNMPIKNMHRVHALSVEALLNLSYLIHICFVYVRLKTLCRVVLLNSILCSINSSYTHYELSFPLFGRRNMTGLSIFVLQAGWGGMAKLW